MKKYFELIIKWMLLILIISITYCVFDRDVDMFNWFMGGMFTFIWVRLTDELREPHLYKKYWYKLRQDIIDIVKTIKAVEIDPDNDVHIGMKGALLHIIEMMDKIVEGKK